MLAEERRILTDGPPSPQRPSAAAGAGLEQTPLARRSAPNAEIPEEEPQAAKVAQPFAVAVELLEVAHRREPGQRHPVRVFQVDDAHRVARRAAGGEFAVHEDVL